MSNPTKIFTLPIIHPDKCCVECKHFYLDTGDVGYSDLTPGGEFTMECQKNHWEFEQYDTEDHYRECILAAKRCKDFDAR